MIGGRGEGGNREVSPHLLFSARGDRSGAGAEAISKEGDSWGKHRFPHGNEPQASDDHPSDSRENVTSVEPSVIVSPLRSLARFTRLPLTSMPFVEPRSTIQYEAPS